MDFNNHETASRKSSTPKSCSPKERRRESLTDMIGELPSEKKPLYKRYGWSLSKFDFFREKKSSINLLSMGEGNKHFNFSKRLPSLNKHGSSMKKSRTSKKLSLGRFKISNPNI